MNPQQWRDYLKDNQPDAQLINQILDDWEASQPPTALFQIDSSDLLPNQFFDPFLM